ncbi:MAG: hypothetical protein JO138_04080 [Acidobacteriaceae bacterium]|nr:hypothetical protein [Acidobacteriaceae bacterium]
MKSTLFLVAAASLLAIPLLPAQEQPGKAQCKPRYEVVDLGTFGGNYSYGYGINEVGWVAGGAATPAETNYVAEKAFLWYGGGPLQELGTLGGRDCPDCSSEAGGPNFWGESALMSETGKHDPNGEDFCGFGTHRQCLGAVWRDWRLTALEPFPGGHNSQAYWLNDFGQVAGFAENGHKDLTCKTGTPHQVLRFEAAIWNRKGEIRELKPLNGDTVGFAFGINNRGQAVGTSGLCSNVSLPPIGPPAGPHAVLWEADGTPINLGTLGGTYNLATSINERGDVAGNAQSAEGGNPHPFLWTKDAGIQDLGVYPGALSTGAPCCHTLNDRHQVAGFAAFACTSTGCTTNSPPNFRAFLWEHGSYRDLNTLVPTDSPLYLQFASSINDAGQITGYGSVKSACPVQSPPAWLVNQSACPLVHAFVLKRLF